MKINTIFGSRLLCALALAIQCYVAAAATVPQTVGYQGRLFTAANQPINAQLSVVFALYSTTTDNNLLWTETQSVTFTNGYFSVQLGSVTPLTSAIFSGAPLFLGAAVDGDTEMTPRIQISSVPYALSAGPDARFGNNTSLAASGKNYVACTLGEIKLFAGSVAGNTVAAGQILPISQNQALFSVLLNTYGGDGQTTFALPDLRAAAPNGLTYGICTAGIFPAKSE
jgi:hypothetical protein